ncbi:diguanylate cyclase [Pseudomonas azotoformans]|uniref:Diguanylate cyclase n=1 Tax=Pseudomonas azotoformans TaxID=47878 RepID=A0A1V2JGX7_PSEAZ|nr:EAL domain-containing protein [Pseudomonas azotoformans]OIN46069.1 diguanylate cyclase [Pseudomonas azotoformans]ONH44525.1 diguanylate cyclase [Pseudomonas azotoformans]SDN24813.1 PAS domain S-box-containing protein/diguanylate cyclase (GGDEF) domain-containing protein [Pseudomonas azotoformans]
MPNTLVPIVRTLSNRTSLSLTRTSLFNFTALLVLVFAAAAYSLIYLAHELDHAEQTESAFYTRKAVQSLEKSLRVTVKDYAFWSDAYKHLHLKVDTDWAYGRGNVGATLFQDFGFQGLFVVNDANRTVYAVVEGQMQPIDLSDWLAQPITQVLEQARAGAEQELPVTAFINVRGSPALVAAAAITPGTDPTVKVDGRPASVLVFVDILDSAQLTLIGNDFGVDQLHIASADEIGKTLLVPLGDNGAAGSLHWRPARPGVRLMGVGLPLLGLAALLVCLMTWVILRRASAAALALDASHASLQDSQDALTTSEARFRDVVEASSDWVWEIDAGWRFTYLSERFENVTGLARRAWIGAAINDLLDTEAGALSQWLNTPSRTADISVQCRYVDAQGQERTTRLAARQMPCGGFRGTATDVTEEVEARRRIEFLSEHDALTGLANRTRLQAFLDDKLKALPASGQPLVMLSLDLDRFKPVNDLLGHAAGDHVLNEVSTRLADCVRHGDLVARVGGDEFVLILTNAGTQDDVESLCLRLIESVEQAVKIGEQEVFVSASIGIVLAPDDASEVAELLRYADIALYEAKAAGRNTWRFYSGEMNARIIERRRLESDLRFAIKHNELRLHLQPRYRIADGQMVGAEALVRWQHPQRGLIPPDTFIPIAEESGLILALSDWVLQTACTSAAQWPEALFVSVNLSSTEFKRGDLVERIRNALTASGIEPARVELEITESVMLEDAAGALAVMHTLKRLGIRIAMDDFGTGYSSLSYLRAFPFDGLKIDRSFLSRLEDSEDDKAIIQAIVGLGRALALTVTAEGIETAGHLEMLRAVSCDEGQGYYLSRPLDIDTFNGLLGTSGKTDSASCQTVS